MRAAKLLLLSALALVATARSARAELVIPPGQDEILAEMLGRGAALPGGCVWAGASVSRVTVASTYNCPSGTHVVELRHPEGALSDAPRTAKFAVAPRASASSPPPPRELIDAIVGRVSAGEGAFRWSEPESKPSNPRPFFTLGRVVVGLGAALALGAASLLLARRRARAPDRAELPEREPASPAAPKARALVAVLSLPWLLGWALREAAEGAAAAHLGRGAAIVAPRAIGFVVLLLASSLPASIVARAPSPRRLWPAFVLAAAAALGVELARAPRPELGFEGLYTQPPGAQWDERVGTSPITAHIEVNDLGFRGRPFDRARSPGALRVALVGDSYVFGTGVGLDDTIGVTLERALTQRWPARRFEVINLGIPGNNIASHVTAYEAAARALAPDAVVMGVLLPNDLSRWDFQVAQREASRLGAYAVARALLGKAGPVLYDRLLLDSEVTPEGLQHLVEQSERLSELRRAPGAPLLVVFSYQGAIADLTSTFGQVQHTIVIGSREPALGESIPGDGHPTGEGNRRYAGLIVDALASDAAFAAAAAR